MKRLAHFTHLFLSLTLTLLLLSISCKKDAALQNTNQATLTVNQDKWTKTSEYILQHEVYDTKILQNGNVAVLANNYIVFDSTFTLLSVTDLFQGSIDSYYAKRLSNPFLTNRTGADGKSNYLIQNYFDEINGKLLSQNIVEFSSFFDVSNNVYGILLDDKVDKVLKKSIRLFMKTDRDTTSTQYVQSGLFTKKEAGSTSNNIIQKKVGTEFNRIACTKKDYVLYNNRNYMGLKFIDPSFYQLDTSIYKQEVSSVLANDEAFYIKNNVGLFETENGSSFLNINSTFNPKCLLTQNLMFGVNNGKACVFDLSTRLLTYLSEVGLPRSYLTDKDYAIGFNNNIVLFTKEGVYQIKYK